MPASTAPAMPPVPTSAQDLADLSAEQRASVVTNEATVAVPWMQAAARLGNTDAQTALGQWLLHGHGLPRDHQQAFVWFNQAAEQGHAHGMNMAGRCLANGWGTPVDLVAAVRWYRLAAHKDLDLGMYNYANQLASGKGVQQDHRAALGWYRLAADMGHAKSMTKMGRYYEDGLVVPRDMDAAFLCYQDGAQGGDFRGQFNLAGMLAAQGDMAEALQWLRKVPLTATPGFKAEAGRTLLESPYPEFRRIGQQMLSAVAAAG